ncbi:MAG: GAF domain-containing protein [Anaerolineae bacterium]
MRHELESTGFMDPTLLQSTVEQATLLLHASGGGFYRYDPAPEKLRLLAAYKLQEGPWEEVLGQVCARREAVIRGSPGHPVMLAMPSIWRDSVRGVLVITDEAPDRVFDERDVALLRPLADLAAAMLQQTERLARMTAQFRALHAIDLALSASLELERVLDLILEKAVDLVGAEHGSLRLLNPETGELVLKAYLGEGWTPEKQAYAPRLGQGIAGRVGELRQPYLNPDVRQDPHYVVLFPEMRSTVAVPLLSNPGEGQGEELLGVLLLESTRLTAFDEQDVELLQALAQEAVIAIQNATQHQKLQMMHQALLDEQERRVAAEKWTVMGQTATALAHRINNLIGVVPASAAEVRRVLVGVEMSPADREWIEANLSRIERNSQYILRISDALFRPFQESGPPTWLDVNRLLNEALQAAGLPSDIQVVRDYDLRLPPVESSSLLVDIFLELILNARRAMEGLTRQQLQVRTRLEPDRTNAWIVIEVRDTGRGIPPEQMAHLWDLFQPSAEGLGFGLWWVRTFIERQGGTIVCESRPGAGTAFTVRLPAVQPAGSRTS